MIYVASDHAADAVVECRNPRRHVGYGLVGVVLEVGFVDTIQTEDVEHGIHLTVVGVVRCAYGIDIVALHEHDIAQHLVGGYGASIDGRGVVAVDPFEQHALTVDKQQGIVYLDIAQTI